MIMWRKNHTNQMATHVFQFTCFIPVAAATFQFSAAAILCYQDIQVRELVVSCWRRLAVRVCLYLYLKNLHFNRNIWFFKHGDTLQIQFILPFEYLNYIQMKSAISIPYNWFTYNHVNRCFQEAKYRVVGKPFARLPLCHINASTKIQNNVSKKKIDDCG